MNRSRAIVAVFLLSAAAGTAPVASPAAASVPALGSSKAFPAGTGFGAIKPKTVFLGGDPTGDFTRLGWIGWGKTTSTGHGDGFYPPPGQPTAAAVKVPVILVASSLGSCQGRYAYRRLAITFVYKGRHEAGSELGLCE